MGERREDKEDCKPVEWMFVGGLTGCCCEESCCCWEGSSMERKELPERRRAASFVERVRAERP